jgi:putative transposase
MPWKASSVMEERLRFVARLLDGEAMTDVCRDFGNRVCADRIVPCQ